MEHQHEHQHCDYNYDPHCCCEHVICLTSMFVHCGATVCASVATTGYLSNTHLCDRCQLCQLSFFSFLPAFLWMHRLHRPLRLPKTWSTTHETAWEWLWFTISRNLVEATTKVTALALPVWVSLQARTCKHRVVQMIWRYLEQIWPNLQPL